MIIENFVAAFPCICHSASHASLSQRFPCISVCHSASHESLSQPSQMNLSKQVNAIFVGSVKNASLRAKTVVTIEHV